MPSVAFNKLQKYIENVHEKAFNLGSDQLMYAFTNTAPNAATNGVLADLVEVSYTNFSSRVATTSSSAQTTGTYKLVLADLTITPVADLPTFRYVYLYSNTATNKELIGYYDYGAGGITVLFGDTFTIDNDPSAGVFTST
jgi:hypothetical protein